MLVISDEEKEAAAKQRVKQTFNVLIQQSAMLLKSIRSNVGGVTSEKLKEILGPDYDIVEGRLAVFTQPFGTDAAPAETGPVAEGTDEPAPAPKATKK